jgi:hypothetical protein
MTGLPVDVNIPGTAFLDLKVRYHEGIDVDDGTTDGVQTVEVRLPSGSDLASGQVVSSYAYCTDSEGAVDSSITWHSRPIIENSEDSSSNELGGNTFIGFKFYLTVPPGGYTWHPGIIFLAGPVWSNEATN